MPWLYDTKTGLVEHQNEAEFILDQPGNLLGSGLVNLGIPDSDTSAQAVTAAQAYVAAHPGSTAPTTSNSTANTNAEKALPVVGPAVASFADVGSALSAIYTTLTDGKRWRSIGWILLGIILIFVGLFMLIGRKVLGAASKLPIPLPV